MYRIKMKGSRKLFQIGGREFCTKKKFAALMSLRRTATLPFLRPEHFQIFQSTNFSTGTPSYVISENIETYRKEIAPWIPIGDFKTGLLSHLSTLDILRAIFVLRLCSLDFIVDRSMQMFNVVQKFGSIGDWILQKTFFNQFVGGDEVARMTEVVFSMKKRGLQLMVLPANEEDVEDARSEKKTYDNNANTLATLIELTSSLGEKNKSVLQLKLSSIIPPNTLEEVSSAIRNQCEDKIQWTRLVEEIANSVDTPSALTLKMNSTDQSYLLDGIQRAEFLIKKAKEVSVNVLTDAEFYSCKPAISTIALALMARHNQREHVVGNTIQGYLKDAVTTIRDELEIVTNLIGVNWYGKVVRGAYMDRERLLANKLGRDSPVCNSYEETNASYNSVIQHILEHISRQRSDQKSHLVVATHNERSIRLAAQRMKDFNLSNNCPSISFAQIYGMADYLSTPLVQHGYTVYKSTPYGPIDKVLPYLARRASENRSVIKGAREERDMLKKELKYRLFSK